MYIKVKVKTSVKREEVRRISDDHFQIELKEKAERNMANNRLIEIFKTMYPDKMIKIISGHHSPSKIFSISD